MNRLENAESMKNQTWGSEWELTNMTCEHGIRIVARHYGTEDTIQRGGSWAHNCGCRDSKGRMWWAHVDSSVLSHGEGTCEITTPIMTYDDIEDAQQILRDLRNEGAIASARYGCGLHIHVGAFNTTDDGACQSATSLRHLVNLMKSHERLLINAVRMTPERYGGGGYARVLNDNFVRELNRQRPQTVDGVKNVYSRYVGTRYTMLNFDSLDDNKTVEFRFFEFHKIHAGEFKAYVQLCMAMCNYAKLITRSSYAPVSTDNEKYTMKCWLTNMGLVGDEFKTCRKMLTKRLAGDTGSRRVRSAGSELDDLGFATEG